MATRPRDPPASGAAFAYPGWVLFASDTSSDDGERLPPGDARTVAGCLTSTGLPISLSICLAAPPAVSRWHIDVPDLLERLTVRPTSVAAHGDSVLISLGVFIGETSGADDAVVYTAGAAPARPPSLSLLPPCHRLRQGSTGLLRCGGDGEFVVADLEPNAVGAEEAKLCVFRGGAESRWELKRLPVRHGEGKRDEVCGWQPDAAVAVGGRYLCWGDLSRGIIFWDALGDGPELQYVSLPLAESLRRRGVRRDDDEPYLRSRSLCVTGAGAGETVKFVDVAPRCCCGGPGATQCPRSKHAFRIRTCTLRTEDMTWWQDGEMDAAELWALPGYRGLPRVPVEFPVVSMDEPGVLCFQICEKHHDWPRQDGDGTVWLVEVDTARKVLRSATRYGEDFGPGELLPSEVSKHLGGNVHETTANAGAKQSYRRDANGGGGYGRGNDDRAVYHGGKPGAQQFYRPAANGRRNPSYPNRAVNPSAPSGGYDRVDRGNGVRPVCQLCGKVGHLASYCFKRFQRGFHGIGNDGRYT